MDLEIIILSEVKSVKTNTIIYHLYVESNFLKSDTNELNYKTETDLCVLKIKMKFLFFMIFTCF